MSGKNSGKTVTNEGVNSQGNSYRSYSDGGYSYKNNCGDCGQKTSTYYDTGKGHSFYENKTQGYSFHENQNQGYRDYSSKK